MKIVDEDIVDPEKVEKKQRLIYTIQRYQDSERFGDIVRKELKITQNYDQLSELSMNECENTLSRIRIHLDNKNLSKFYDNMATTIAVTYEALVDRVYSCQGFSDMLLDNDEFWNIFERFKCEYQFPSVNPSMQLLFIIGQTTLMAHHLAPVPSDEPYEMQPPTISDELARELDIPPTIPEEPITTIPEPTNETKSEPVNVKPLTLGAML